jgi:hypothetical protein
MREDVKDLLARATASFEPTPIEADEVIRREGRRQRSARIAAVFVALAVFAAAGTLSWVAFRPTSGTIAGSGPQREVSATVHGITLTYPSSWTLVDLWPLASGIASWPEPVGTAIDVPEGTREKGGLPVLQLSSVDLGLRSACGSNLTGDQAVLYVAQNGGPYLVGPDAHARWSESLRQDDGPCGPGWYAYRHSSVDKRGGSGSERPFLVFAAFGADASTSERAAVFAAFDSLSFEPVDDFLHPPAESSPTYVTPSSSPSSSADLFFPTTGLRQGEGGAVMDALLTGPLVVREGCVLIGQPGDYSLPVWWSGFTAERDRTGRLVVRDGEGSIVAIEGENFSMGGGYTAEFDPTGRVGQRATQVRRLERWLGYSIPDRCLASDVYGVWVVGDTDPLESRSASTTP